MRSALIIFFSYALLGLVANSCLADPAIIEGFVTRVLESHPLLKATTQEIAGSRADVLSNQGLFDPILRGSVQSYPFGDYSGTYGDLTVEQPLELYGSKLLAGYRRGGGGFPVYEDYLSTNDDGEVRAGVEVPLLRDGAVDRRRAAISRAIKQIEATELTFRQRQVELSRAAAHAYLEWMAAYQKREAYRNLLATAKDRDVQLAKRVQSGDLARIDYVDNQRQVLQREAQLLAAERSLAKARFDVSLFLWDGDKPALDLLEKYEPKLALSAPPRLTSAAVIEATDSALSNRAEHKRIKNQIEQQEIERDLAENQLLPRLDLQLLASKDLGSGSSTRDEAELKTGVRIEIPLQTRSQRGRIQAVEAKTRELTHQFGLFEARITTEVADAFNALSVGHERHDVASKEVTVSVELEHAERAKFQQGESNLIFVNLREQGTVDALVRKIDALVDCWKSYASFVAAKGDVFSPVSPA